MYASTAARMMLRETTPPITPAEMVVAVLVLCCWGDGEGDVLGWGNDDDDDSDGECVGDDGDGSVGLILLEVSFTGAGEILAVVELLYGSQSGTLFAKMSARALSLNPPLGAFIFASPFGPPPMTFETCVGTE